MIYIENGEVSGVGDWTGDQPNGYLTLLPLTHPSGVPNWILDPAGEIFVDTDGTPYHLHKRTLAQIQADPRYIAWAAAQAIDAAQNQAKTDFSTIPAWMKTFTAAKAEAYIETNVTTLATAKVAIKNMARMLILLRDYVRYAG